MNYELNNYSESSIENLFALPKKNVESRIKQLEAEIQTRQYISDQALSSLCTHKSRINEQLSQVQYLGALTEQRDFSKQLTRLEETVINEMTSCFNDVSKLKERLQEAKEELETEIQKLKLTITESYKNHSNESITTTNTSNYQFQHHQLNQFLPSYSVFN